MTARPLSQPVEVVQTLIQKFVFSNGHPSETEAVRDQLGNVTLFEEDENIDIEDEGPNKIANETQFTSDTTKHLDNKGNKPNDIPSFGLKAALGKVQDPQIRLVAGKRELRSPEQKPLKKKKFETSTPILEQHKYKLFIIERDARRRKDSSSSGSDQGKKSSLTRK
mmetsp:Transcript_42702/g.65543  ORF Transcript_42702/g.65543 Transcript_42702/m.65543 type:complete len:166 (-) Transcript_42702:324-821(-)|eukprot:CAMPEP_0170499024 /NCGR_PEP_ID=MMETSP0208-20121228/29813_1 /TAXON_ID=197538 /ORGANISM="Strombidium inclinatum, Strain S3" /LENGTH=165 /DNA_ID=CAMNT_0010776401 /DNA_START=977 /DNA_END=1474 /DNA_ORIENTATION=+